jgi:LysM repeat protein
MAKEGETLWEIAKRFHTTEGEIVSTNNLKSSDIRQGEKLLIVKNVG